jgi:NitT/TauT family transport system permease protein
MKNTSKWLLPLIPLFAGSVFIEFLVRSGFVPSYILPAPSDVLRSLVDDWTEYSNGFYSTALSAIIGLALSSIIGTVVAILLSLSKLLRRAFLPYAIFFQTVPVIALAPVLIIWFGFGRPTVIASAFIVSLFPVIANSILGFESTEPRLYDLFKLHRATRFATLWKLQLPSALPAIFGGLRIASGLAVIGAIVGEFIAGGGLGEVVDAARTQQRLDKVFAAVVLCSLLGLILVVLIDLASRLTLRSWYAGEHNGKEDRTR